MRHTTILTSQLWKRTKGPAAKAWSEYRRTVGIRGTPSWVQTVGIQEAYQQIRLSKESHSSRTIKTILNHLFPVPKLMSIFIMRGHKKRLSKRKSSSTRRSSRSERGSASSETSSLSFKTSKTSRSSSWFRFMIRMLRLDMKQAIRQLQLLVVFCYGLVGFSLTRFQHSRQST